MRGYLRVRRLLREAASCQTWLCFAALALGSLTRASPAAAQVTEPNGTVVPGPSSSDAEVPLATFFADQGESIGALTLGCRQQILENDEVCDNVDNNCDEGGNFV